LDGRNRNCESSSNYDNDEHDFDDKHNLDLEQYNDHPGSDEYNDTKLDCSDFQF